MQSSVRFVNKKHTAGKNVIVSPTTNFKSLLLATSVLFNRAKYTLLISQQTRTNIMIKV